ncbi:MAG: hypothetical protein R3A52_01120 [Polyangiales bacterium]
MRSRPDVMIPLAAALAAVVCGAHCGDPDTGRYRVRFTAAVRGSGADVSTSLGWAVHLDTAKMVVGALRWYEGPPLFGARLWRRLTAPSVAWAHPGHYVPGEALADMVTPRVVDLLAAGGSSVGAVDGVNGTPLSGHVVLQGAGASLGESAAGFDGGTVLLEGSATKDGQTVRFVARPAILNTVEGVPAHGVLDAAQRGWTVTVDLAHWVDRMDFSTLPMGATADAPREVTLELQPGNALYRAVTSAGTYRFEMNDGDGGS